MHQRSPRHPRTISVTDLEENRLERSSRLHLPFDTVTGKEISLLIENKNRQVLKTYSKKWFRNTKRSLVDRKRPVNDNSDSPSHKVCLYLLGIGIRPTYHLVHLDPTEDHVLATRKQFDCFVWSNVTRPLTQISILHCVHCSQSQPDSFWMITRQPGLKRSTMNRLVTIGRERERE